MIPMVYNLLNLYISWSTEQGYDGFRRDVGQAMEQVNRRELESYQNFLELLLKKGNFTNLSVFPLSKFEDCK